MTTPTSSKAAAIATTLEQQEDPPLLQSPPERWLGGGGSDDLFWLLGYDLEVVKCVKGEQSKSWRSSNGVEGSTVIFKLCPSSSSPFSSYLKADDSHDADRYSYSDEADKYDDYYDSSTPDDSHSTYYKSGDYNVTMTSHSSSSYNKSRNSNNGSGSSSNKKSEKGCGYYSVGVNTFVYGYMDSTYGKSSDAYYQVYDYLTGCQLLQHASDHTDCDYGNRGYGSYWGSSYSYSYSSAAAWVGPTCTDDGTNIRLGTFSDPYCTAEIKVENVQNADKVPYTSTGIFPTYSDSGSEKMKKISCYHKNNYQYELSQACITPYQFACEKCETHVLKEFDGSSSGDPYAYDSYTDGDYDSSYGNSYGTYGGSSHTHTYDESYGNGRASGCDYLGHWVSGLSSKPTSFWSAGGGLSSFSTAAYGTTTPESRIAMVVVASVLATLGVVAMFVRRRERNTSNDAEAVETAFEIMKPREFIEDSRASTISAMKKARNGINIAARTVVDLTRSNTLRAEDGSAARGDRLDGRNVTFELGRVPMESPGFAQSSLKPGMSPTHIWSSWVPPKDDSGTSNKDGVEV